MPTKTTNTRATMDDAPLFAGLDDFVLIKGEKRTTERPQTALPAEKPAPRKKRPAPAPQPATKKPKTPKSTLPPDPNAILLSVAEMCTLLRISRATLVRMDKAGNIPGKIKLGGSVRFHRETVETWLKGLISPTT